MGTYSRGILWPFTRSLNTISSLSLRNAPFVRLRFVRQNYTTSIRVRKIIVHLKWSIWHIYSVRRRVILWNAVDMLSVFCGGRIVCMTQRVWTCFVPFSRSSTVVDVHFPSNMIGSGRPMRFYALRTQQWRRWKNADEEDNNQDVSVRMDRMAWGLQQDVEDSRIAYHIVPLIIYTDWYL